MYIRIPQAWEMNKRKDTDISLYTYARHLAGEQVKTGEWKRQLQNEVNSAFFYATLCLVYLCYSLQGSKGETSNMKLRRLPKMFQSGANSKHQVSSLKKMRNYTFNYNFNYNFQMLISNNARISKTLSNFSQRIQCCQLPI